MKTNNNWDQCVKPKHSRKLLKRRIFFRYSNVRSIWHGRDSVVLWGLHRCGRVKFTLFLLFVWRFKRSCTGDFTGRAWWLASWSLNRLNKKRNLSVATDNNFRGLEWFLCFFISLFRDSHLDIESDISTGLVQENTNLIGGLLIQWTRSNFSPLTPIRVPNFNLISFKT